MMEQLRIVGDHLRTSIDNYLGVCSTIHDSLSSGKTLPGFPQELSVGLEKEYALMMSFEQKIQQARIAIGHARNSFTPINKLPSEILIRIFHLVSADPCQLRFFDGSMFHLKHNPYLDWVTHVCSRWRVIALASPSLWAHIDLSLDLPWGRGILDRAETYAKRVDETPCELHLDDIGYAHSGSNNVSHVVGPLASHLSALEFVITSPKLSLFHEYVFNTLVLNCNPEVFRRLCIRSNESLLEPFFEGPDDFVWARSQDQTDPNPGLALNLLGFTKIPTDRQLTGITTLHLQGVFFRWSSKLYHGLVDLRLTSPPNEDATFIDQSAMIQILSASPGLKILHFSLNLTMTEGLENERVPLQDLEVVHISTMSAREDPHSTFHVGSLLRLISPGSKPLELTLQTTTDSDEPMFDSNDTREFFARSRVEKLRVNNGCPSIDCLRLCHLPDLKILWFDSCDIQHFVDSEAALGFPTWIVQGAIISIFKLRWMVQLCPTGLVLSQVSVIGDYGKMEFDHKFREAFPTVRAFEGDVDPHIAGWD
ncbi:unnamed protein product [Rhizoctonia solani]|uniref:F-box domain-containing protein n=1 Tax=Rhizoctonia solani TaxID=456999 RepID=A0A8H2X4H1_9AGAM|nr:unnamed protein product [Rhizoctonia solani]